MNRNQQNAINRMQRWPTKEQQQFVSGLAEWMITKPEALDRKVMELAREVNPVAAKMLAALDEPTPEAALAKLEAPIALKSKVYFMSETGTGEGIVYRIDGNTAKVYEPKTMQMHTVEIALMEVLK